MKIAFAGIGIAAAATLVGGVAGCSNTTSTTSSSAPTGSPNAGAELYKITLNGQAITHAGNGVRCGDEYGRNLLDIMIGAPNGGYPPRWSNYVSITNETPPKVRWVGIKSDDEKTYNYASIGGPGDAQVSKSDKTYKVTGHITSSDPAHLVPFEFDATCP